MNIAKKVAPFLETRRRLLPALIANVAKSDRNGSATGMVGLSHRFIGIAEFLVNKDVGAFRRELALAARCKLALLERYDSGGEVSPSYAAIGGTSKALLDSLAAGEFELSTAIGRRLGGRLGVESEHDRKVDVAFGHALQSAVLQTEDAGKRLSAFIAETEKCDVEDYRGYAEALIAIVEKRHEDFSKAIVAIAEGHRWRTENDKELRGTEDEWLCVGGVGIANLLMFRGYSVDSDHPLLPGILLKRPGQ